MTYAWIKGYLSFDVDGDNTELNTAGHYDQGVAGRTVTLLDAWGNVVATTTTNQYGGYQFDVHAGTYSVKFPSIDGYQYALKDQGSDRFDSDANANGVTDAFYIGSGQTKKDLDAVVQVAAPTGGGHAGNSICIEAEDFWESGVHYHGQG